MLNKILSYLNLTRKGYPEIPRKEKNEILLTTIENPDEKVEANNLYVKLGNVHNYSKSHGEFWKDYDRFGEIMTKAYTRVPYNNAIPHVAKKSIYNDYLMYGEADKEPVASTFYDQFSNAFEVYSYLYKNHPVVYSCIDIIRQEIANDGYVLKHLKGVAKATLRKTFDLLRSQKVENLRLDIACHLKLYGNAFLIKVKDKKLSTPGKKVENLKLLDPQKIKPKRDLQSGELTGWMYKKGNKWEEIPVEDLYHLSFFNADADTPTGDPPLQAGLLDIEIDLAIKNYVRQILEKGFLGSVVIGLDPPVIGDDWDSNDADTFIQKWTDEIKAQFMGSTAGGAPFVGTGIKTATNLNPIGSQDAPFPESTKANAKIICMCLGVPSEKLGFNRSESVQYVPSFVEYSVNAGFDKSIYCLVGMVDDFLNEFYMKGIHKIYDVIIQAGGRFGSLTKTAAEVIKLLAEAGPIITVNQALSIILGWEELAPENPRGNYVLDNTKGRMEGLNSSEIPRYPGIIDPENEDLELTSANRQLKNAKDLKWETWDTFFGDIVRDQAEERNIKSGKYEKREVFQEDEMITTMSIRPGRSPRYFYEGRAA